MPPLTHTLDALMKWMLLTLTLAACSAKTPAATAMTEAAPMEAMAPMEETPGAPMAETPGAPMAETPSVPASACSQEIMVECGEGTTDGCMVADADGNPLTTTHVCTPDTEPGPPCAQEIARECGAGMVDACSTTPALAATHVCVQAPG